MRARDIEERTIQVELPESGLKAIEVYRQRMLELIGVELTESQVAAMLIHFGKNVEMGRAPGGPMLALPAPAATATSASTPAAAVTLKRRSTIKERAARAKPTARTCACGCGGKLSPRSRASARWLRGHHKRGTKATPRITDEPEAEVVWDGRGPLSKPWDRRGEDA